MLTLKAQLINTFVGNSYTKDDGTVVPPKHKLQLMTKIPLKSGGYKNSLLDISIPESKVSLYAGKEGEEVDVEVGYFGDVNFYGI